MKTNGISVSRTWAALRDAWRGFVLPQDSHGLDPVVDQGPKLSGANVAVEGAQQHVESIHTNTGGIETAQPHTAPALDQVATDPALKHLDLDRIRSLIALCEQAVTLDNPEVCLQLGLTLRYHGQQLTAHAKAHEGYLDWRLSAPHHLTPGQLQLRQAVDVVIANSR